LTNTVAAESENCYILHSIQTSMNPMKISSSQSGRGVLRRWWWIGHRPRTLGTAWRRSNGCPTVRASEVDPGQRGLENSGERDINTRIKIMKAYKDCYTGWRRCINGLMCRTARRI